MINVNSDALAVIFPNTYDKFLPEMTRMRLMASIPFASRYRLIDFLLSSMVNGGIDNVAILVTKNYHSLTDHLGSGREWDLARKYGGLSIFPPYAVESLGVYHGWIQGLESIRNFLVDQKERYVVISDSNIAMNFDFADFIEKHAESGADVTIAYKREPIAEELMENTDPSKAMYYTLDLDGKKVRNININPKVSGDQNYSLDTFIVSREWLIRIIDEAYVRGDTFFVRDVLGKRGAEFDIRSYEFKGYTARITGMRSYLRENMKLLDEENLNALFSAPVYTKIRDDNPTVYHGETRASNVMVADGCEIQGEIENSILFRGVKIGKGAKVRNSILLQDTVVGDNVELDHVVTDKGVTITSSRSLRGSESFPVYIDKGKKV